MNKVRRHAYVFGWRVAVMMWLSACSSAIGPSGYTYDPWEPVNRKVFAFNEVVDTVLLKPIATGYQAIMPELAQTGVENFFGNIEDVGSVFNSLLQFKFEQAAWGFARVINNTVYGLGGFIDVGTMWGNKKIHADFSSTLAHYGVESGPYVVLPFFGPSTPRDGFGKVVDGVAFNPINRFADTTTQRTAMAVSAVSKRAKLLDLERAAGNDTGDKYTLMRDSWIQYRWGQLEGGARNKAQQEAIDDVFKAE